ncbi:unnamed protein product [Phytophthora fragariaefolia]|uniref:Unnamed protein product n=1 Tax=Phytophthora fragariaefolia TaxID=1490495 RepID=A0A9W6XWM4_9STRA|nr:unnamed protein product [Phytophthora fragariaefolia]
MPSPSEIQSRFGSTAPPSHYALYSCNGIIDDDATKELDFDPAPDQRRDYYIGLFHELRWYGNKKTSRRSRVPQWQALCQSWGAFVENVNKDPAGYRERVRLTRGDEEEGSYEDIPMDDVSRDGSPPQDPLPSVVHATPSKKISSAAAGLLSLDEAMKQVLTGILPATRTYPSGIQDVAPTRQVSPSTMASSSHCFIVRVLASASAYRDSKYLPEGYGGVEALVPFEGLSEQDPEDWGRAV